jgi:PKD repeat protein
VDTPKPQRKPEALAGRLMLGLGDDAGMTILREAQAGETQTLAEALACVRRERHSLSRPSETLEHGAKRTADAMRKVQEVLDRFTEIAEGRIDPGTLGGWADELIGWSKGLDPDEHWQERLRVLRTLVLLLALLGRWLELAQSLSGTLQAAVRLGDGGARAWAMHELGTLHLAAEQHAEADDDLSEALTLRMKAADERGVRATEANLLVLCKMLRSRLHPTVAIDQQPSAGSTDDGLTSRALESLMRRPVLLLALGLAILGVGGVAGEAVTGTPRLNARRLTVAIESVPVSPQTSEPVVFRTKVANRADPDHYIWLFGDGEGADSVDPTHVYLRPGSYKVTVAVSGAHDTVAGEATRTVIVHPRSSPLRPGRPTTSFTFTPLLVLAGHTVRFKVGGSQDPDKHATIIDYLWNFGDGKVQIGIDPIHVYMKSGTYTVELIVVDTRGVIGRITRTIVVEKRTSRSVKPAFTSVTGATFVTGTSERFPVTTTGRPTPVVSESGRLPRGVGFVGGALSGTPTATGIFPLTFTATNRAGSTAQPFMLTVKPQPVIHKTPAESKPTFTSADNATFEYYHEECFQVTARGVPTPTIALVGQLPKGVKFDEEALIGTALQTGTFMLTLTASNKAGSAVQKFTLKVAGDSATYGSKPSHPRHRTKSASRCRQRRKRPGS